MNILAKLRQLRKSKTFSIVIGVLVGLFVSLFIFHAGVSYGERRALHRLNPMTNLPTPEFGFFSHSFIPHGHGAVGVISGIALPTLTLQTREGEVETVTVSSSTVIRSSVSGVVQSILAVGQNVAILGEPEDGSEHFIARFIRILTDTSAATTTKN